MSSTSSRARRGRLAGGIIGVGTVVMLAMPGMSPSTAAPLSGVLATDAAEGPIAASSNTAAWNRWDDRVAGYRIVVDRGGTIRTLDVPPSSRPFGLSAGRGPDRQTWLVWSRCTGDPDPRVTAASCDIEGYDLGTKAPKSFPFAARSGVSEVAPAIRDDRLVWAVERPGGLGAVHLARTDGGGDRIVEVMPPSTCELSIWAECFAATRAAAESSALSGDRVAVTSRISTAGGDAGICGLGTVRLLDSRTSAVRSLDSTVCGLSGQSFTDTTFDADGRLWWRLSCGGDQSACEGTRAGPFRQTEAGPQRLVTTVGSRLAGVAVASRTPILLTLAPRTAQGCRVGAESPATGRQAYRCGTVTAVAEPSYQDVRGPRENLPPAGYLTVKGTTRLLVLRPPAKLACSRGDAHPKAGATLWAGVSWVDGQRRTHGPAVPVTATSGGRTVKGTVPKGAANHEGQITTTLDLGGPSKACDRTWTLTYRPSGTKPIRFTTRVLAR